MRDSIWLQELLDKTWGIYFSSITKSNPIHIRFGRKSKRRLGSIVLTSDKVSVITITALFKDEQIPEYVVMETIAHELIHYIHGFSSTMKKKFKYPHQGGIIKNEMNRLGLDEIYTMSKAWMSENWIQYIEHDPSKAGKRVRSRRKRKNNILQKLLMGRTA